MWLQLAEYGIAVSPTEVGREFSHIVLEPSVQANVFNELSAGHAVELTAVLKTKPVTRPSRVGRCAMDNAPIAMAETKMNGEVRHRIVILVFTKTG